MSRELILTMSITIDGFVADANSRADWIFPNRTEASTKYLSDLLGEVSLHAMGRISYEGMAGFWPTAAGPFARPMNEIPKAVFSKTGNITRPNYDNPANDAPQPDQAVLESWQHPTVLGKDLVADIQRLKAEDGKPINALGGATFASSLIAAHQVDLFRLITHPLALGQGLPIFANLKTPLHLKLEDVKQFESGVLIKTYRPLYS